MSALQSKRIFITGGAGFIGTHLVPLLLSEGAGTIVLYDSLLSQVHGDNARFPDFGKNVRCIRGDVNELKSLTEALVASDPDIIVHLAAETGTGQSQDEVVRYCQTNMMGTANLLTAIAAAPDRRRKFLLASSRAVYGEGPQVGAEDGQPLPAVQRTKDHLDRGDFNVYSPSGKKLRGVAATSDSLPSPASVYASTKLAQEHLLLNCCEQRNLNPVILRFQNVYGPGQSLKNPYTGVLSIFANQILADEVLDIYEDGEIVRDFVFVDDVASACVAAIKTGDQTGAPVNIGSGTPTTILHAAQILLRELGKDTGRYFISGKYRLGDIRFASADVSEAKSILKWQPAVGIEEGLSRLAKWAREEFAG